ncbi:indolepyruvate ferredoxin oxidoreductase subunit alpha [Streptomyces sp. NPDC090499]|jgi:NAD-dependent dihydropyrimidine dehydrogenase PreA subunit|uniref:indolepyruvate ferredoxin oxidoreductase subunit alpha n=1 Tax=unclassified Streptomyces TaxID=2593676 RepID=UPI0037F2355F
MTYFITDACLDVMDQSCVEECPVDCIYEGGRRAYINPAACIDCGNCLQVCPVDAIGRDSVLDEATRHALDDNARFFTEILPGRTEPLGNPRGALHLGPVGVDIARIGAAQ